MNPPPLGRLGVAGDTQVTTAETNLLVSSPRGLSPFSPNSHPTSFDQADVAGLKCGSELHTSCVTLGCHLDSRVSVSSFYQELVHSAAELQRSLHHAEPRTLSFLIRMVRMFTLSVNCNRVCNVQSPSPAGAQMSAFWGTRRRPESRQQGRPGTLPPRSHPVTTLPVK